MTRFVRFCAFLSVLFFASNVFAAGYTCSSTKTYTSCKNPYYLSSGACYDCTSVRNSAVQSTTSQSCSTSCSQSCSSSCSVSCGVNESCPTGYTCTYNSDTCSGTKYGTQYGTKTGTQSVTVTCNGYYTGSSNSSCTGCSSTTTSTGTCGNYGSCGSYGSCTDFGSCSASSSSCTCSIKTQTCNTLCDDVRNSISTTPCTTETSITGGKRIGSGTKTCNGYYTNTACYSAGESCSGCSSYGSCNVTSYSCSCNSGYHVVGSGSTCTCEPDCSTSKSCSSDFSGYSGTYNECTQNQSSKCYKSCTKTCSGNDTSSCPYMASCTYDTSYQYTGTQYYGGSCSATAGKCPVESYTCPYGYFDNGSECQLCRDSGTCPSGYREGGTYYNSCTTTAESACYQTCTKTCSGNATSSCPSNATCTYNTSYYTSGKKYYGGSCNASSSTCPVKSYTCNSGYYDNGSGCSSCTGSGTCPSGWRDGGTYYNSCIYDAGDVCYKSCTAYTSGGYTYTPTSDKAYYSDSCSYSSACTTACNKVENDISTISCTPSNSVANAYSTTCPTGTKPCTGNYTNTACYSASGVSVCSGCSQYGSCSTSCYAKSCKSGYYLDNGSCLDCGPTYPYSSAGTTGGYDFCYRYCTTSDVPNSSDVSGRAYSDGVGDSCEATSCEPGYYLSNGSCKKCESGCTCAGGTAQPVCCSTSKSCSSDFSGYSGTYNECTQNQSSKCYKSCTKTCSGNDTSSCPDNATCTYNTSYQYTGTQYYGGSCSATAGKCPIISFTCDRGYYKNSAGTACVKCESGYYCTGDNTRKTCTSWRANTNTNGLTGSTGTSACVCAAGYRLNGSSCTACDKGTYKASNGNTTCTDAGSGYYVDTTAATSRKTCPATAAGSDNGRDAATDCYVSCSAKSISNGTTTVVNAKEYYSGSAYPACTFNVNCNAKYGASGNKTTSPACTVCENGQYSAGGTNACAVCNIPDNSNPTSNASTINGCSWTCKDGYNQTADNQCGQFCDAGITHLHLGNGVSIPLYSSALTSPAINVKWNDTVCYGSLEIGNASGLNVKVGSTTYHAVN